METKEIAVNKRTMEDAFKNYAAGFAAGVATVLVGHPFDTIKVKLQTQNTEVNTVKYRNAAHCGVHILKAEGIKGLYKGATSSFVGVALESSLLFGAYSQMRQALQGGESAKLELSSIVPAAAVGGACISMILCPSELVKCRLQVQASQKAPNVSCLQSYEGPFDCVRKTIANDGIRGMFKGGLTTLLRECVGNSFFFTTYEFSRYYLMSAYGFSQETLSKESEIGLSESSLNQKYSRAAFEGLVDIFSGGLAGMVFWVAVLPLDVVKTRVQTAVDPKASRNPLYNLKLICKRVGLKGLYTGLGPTLVRAFPANAAAMLTWELTAKFLGVRRYDKQTLDCV